VDDARAFFKTVRAEVGRLRHDAVASEHVLLALLRDPSGDVSRVLREVGVDPRGVAEEANRRARPPRAHCVPGQIPFEHEMKAVLEVSIEEAGGPKAPRLTHVHLLLALLRSEGLGGGVLRSHGVRVEDARRAAALLG
jgi:ATP-dependent Clp protease ATP-binding subunit ClpC